MPAALVPLHKTPHALHYLLLSGDVSCHQQPEEPFRQGLLPARGFGQQLLALGYAVSTETDALAMREGRDSGSVRGWG